MVSKDRLLDLKTKEIYKNKNISHSENLPEETLHVTNGLKKNGYRTRKILIASAAKKNMLTDRWVLEKKNIEVGYSRVKKIR